MKTKDLTVVTACKNRDINLKKARENIVKLNNIYEHLVVDWSSETPLNLEEDKNLRVVLRQNESHYWASRAYNFGINLVTTDYVLKLDADTLINFEKFNNLDYSKYDLIIFYKERYDPGNFLVTRNLFEKVNGFNEYIFGWGWEDHDLINRLIKNTKNTKVLEVFDFIEKIKHNDNERVNIEKYKYDFQDNQRYSYAVKKAFNQTNSYISSLNVWKEQKREYINSQNEINHFYSVKQLSKIIVYKHKFFFFRTLFMVMFPRKKIYRRIAPIFYSLLRDKNIKKIFGIDIYPLKN